MKGIPMGDLCICRDLHALRDFAEAAIQKGMKTLSCVIRDQSLEQSAFDALCAEYDGQLQILSVQAGAQSPILSFDYSIGEIEKICFDDKVISFPKTEEEVRACIPWKQDIYRFLRACMEMMARLVDGDVAPEVIRLLDLDLLWNANGAWFDANDRRYLGYVLKATDALLQKDVVFEVRVLKHQKGRSPILYPPLLALRRIGERRGRVMLASEATAPDQLGASYGEAIALLRACGIGCVYYREKNGWKSKAI